MFRTKLSLLSPALLCLASSLRAYAFDDWQPINPDELKMTADATHQATPSFSTMKKPQLEDRRRGTKKGTGR